MMWRHDGRVWRQLTPEGCALMQRLARRTRRRKIPVTGACPMFGREGDLCLVVAHHARLEFDPKLGCLVTVPETSHHYVDPLPRQRQRERDRLMEAQLQMPIQCLRHAQGGGAGGAGLGWWPKRVRTHQ
jgi:hypothetical protein